MGLITRRDVGKFLIAGSAGLWAAGGGGWTRPPIDSVIRGVQIGAQSYSFRDRNLDECIRALQVVSLGECELWDGHVAPAHLNGEDLRKWWVAAPRAHFQEIYYRFQDAGIQLYAVTYDFRKEFTDEEIECAFRAAEGLNVKYIISSANVSVAPRVDKYAEKHKITVGFHGQDATANPDEFSTPETFARAMKGASPYFGISLDIGHFMAAGYDPVDYIRQHHEKIICLHIRDRKKNQGANLPFGEGDTPIAEVLRLLRDNKWKIPANIEYEYGEGKNLDSIAEVKKCFRYCRNALQA